MPKGSKRVAARQAALSRKRKQPGPRPSVIHQQPSVEPQAGAADGGAALPLPELQRPRGSARSPAVSAVARPPVPAASRRALPQNPYLKGDLSLIGVLTAAFLVVLIVLAVFLR